MDDDGLPDAGCLPRLLEHAGDFDFWGPVVVDEDDPSRLVLPDPAARAAPASCTGWPTSSAAAVDGVIRDVVIPFNGVLVTRELVERIGLPREEFFIWGDDTSTVCAPSGPAPGSATVVAAAGAAPRVGDLGTPMMFGRTTYNHSPSDLKHYCMARNNLLNLRDYRGWLARARVRGEDGVVLLRSPVRRRPGSRLSLGAMRAGLRGDFTGHRRFLVIEPVTESVAVVVVTYNRADLLARMLDGLAAQTRLPDAVFVVDNASTDHTREVLAARTDLPLTRDPRRRRTSAAPVASTSACRRRTTRASTGSG